MADTAGDTASKQQEESFVGIHKPHLAEDEDQLLTLWGRFWGNKENKAGAFYSQFNLDEEIVSVWRLSLHEDQSSIEPFDPDQNPMDFKKDLPNEPTTGANIPRAEQQIFEELIRNVIEEQQDLNNLKSILKDKNRDEFTDWIYDFLSQFIKKGDLTYQIKGQLTHRNVLDQMADPSTSKNGDEETATGSDESKDDRNYLPISLSTSPMNGEFPRDISEGTEIFVRATGPIVEQLPESMVEDDNNDISTELEGNVINTQPQPDLPPDFDGSPEDYWKIQVVFLEGKYGEGFIHKDEQLKLVESDEEESSSIGWIFSPTILITTGVIILGLVALAYIIFG